MVMNNSPTKAGPRPDPQSNQKRLEPGAAEFPAELDQTVECAVCHSECSIRRAVRSWT